MINNTYNPLAPYYDFLAGMVFGKSLLQAKCHFLGLLPPGANILLIGGGTGQTLPWILKGHCQNQVVYLEKSSKMIAIAMKRLDKKMIERVRFIEGDESNLPEGEKYEVVITHFFLDQFKDDRLTALNHLLYDRLKTSGLWLFTDFELKKGQPHYWWQNILIKTMFAFFKVTTNVEADQLPEFNLFFKQLGMTLIGEKHFFKKLIVARVYKK